MNLSDREITVSKIEKIDVHDLRTDLAKHLNEVQYGNMKVVKVITRYGKPTAMLVPLGLYHLVEGALK